MSVFSSSHFQIGVSVYHFWFDTQKIANIFLYINKTYRFDDRIRQYTVWSRIEPTALQWRQNKRKLYTTQIFHNKFRFVELGNEQFITAAYIRISSWKKTEQNLPIPMKMCFWVLCSFITRCYCCRLKQLCNWMSWFNANKKKKRKETPVENAIDLPRGDKMPKAEF